MVDHSNSEQLDRSIMFNQLNLFSIMAKQTNISDIYGDIQTLPQAMDCIQRLRTKQFYLIWEDWDWFVVLQCLQDHHLFKSNPKRPPIKAFVQWLNDNGVPQLRTHFNPYQLSLASRQLRDERFPWSNTACSPSILRRWRVLYKQLSNMLQPLQTDYHSTQNFV